MGKEYEKTDYSKIVQVVRATIYFQGKKKGVIYAKNAYDEIDILTICELIDTGVETIDENLNTLADRLINIDIDKAIKGPGINFRQAFDNVAADIKYATEYKKGSNSQEPNCYLTTSRFKEYKENAIEKYNTKQKKYNEQFKNNIFNEYKDTFFFNEDWEDLKIEYDSVNCWEAPKKKVTK